MYLLSLANRVPARSYTQHECWELAQAAGLPDRIAPRSAALLERLLTANNGIARRHFAAEDIERLFTRSPEDLNRDFERAAPALSAEALRTALTQASTHPAELDALIVCTCTGYLCPGVSSHVAERLGLRPDCFLLDLVGLGCGAAIPALRAAACQAAARPEARIGVVAVEICSAAFYLDDDPGVLVSLCLFGDGASASVWSGQAPTENAWRADTFTTIHRPGDRECLRFTNRDGYLRNQLHLSVPGLAGEAVAALHGQSARPGDRVIAHTGGRDVIAALRQALPDSPPLTESETVLRDYGNQSSPSVLFALERALQDHPSDALWLTSFGAGFAAHACRLERP